MHMFRLTLVAAATVAAVLAVGVASPAPAQAEPDGPAATSTSQIPRLTGPAQTTHAGASRYVRQNPGAVPVGVNDFACVRPKEHPRPVVLLHGTDSTAYSDYAAIGPRLVDAGYCVFALNYGGRPGEASYGTEDITASGAQVAAFVDDVLAATGSTEVDIVGYSQGATVGRYFINKLGGAKVVDRWVGLASPTYGSSLYGLVPVAALIPGTMEVAAKILPRELVSPALWQQAQGSPFLNDLNSPTDTVPGVEYTTIASRVDEVIQPATNVALQDPAATNVIVQDLCPVDQSGHFRMPYDDFTIAVVLAALDPAAEFTGQCVPVPLGDGILDMIIAENS